MLPAGFIVMTAAMGALSIWLHVATHDPVMRLSAVAMPLTLVLCSEVEPINSRDFGIAASTFARLVANFGATLFLGPETKGVSPASHFVT